MLHQLFSHLTGQWQPFSDMLYYEHGLQPGEWGLGSTSDRQWRETCAYLEQSSVAQTTKCTPSAVGHVDGEQVSSNADHSEKLGAVKGVTSGYCASLAKQN